MVLYHKLSKGPLRGFWLVASWARTGRRGSVMAARVSNIVTVQSDQIADAENESEDQVQVEAMSCRFM